MKSLDIFNSRLLQENKLVISLEKEEGERWSSFISCNKILVLSYISSKFCIFFPLQLSVAGTASWFDIFNLNIINGGPAIAIA